MEKHEYPVVDSVKELRKAIARVREAQKLFAEYTQDGFVTTFHVTEQIPCRVWRFKMENANMKGDWSGEFEQLGGATRVVFTERVTVKKPILKPIVKLYLKLQQKKYITDLEKALK